jgi:hypothetical protein
MIKAKTITPISTFRNTGGMGICRTSQQRNPATAIARMSPIMGLLGA